MPTCEIPPRVLKKIRSPSVNCVLEMRLVKLYCSLAVLGILRPYTAANKNCEKAEQSTPFFVVPPKRYGVPYQSSMNSNIFVFFTSSARVFNKTEYFTWSCDK